MFNVSGWSDFTVLLGALSVFASAPVAGDDGTSLVLPKPDSCGDLVLVDDFERSESQEDKDEPGNGWTTNSDSRAAGRKQVDLRDGHMAIKMHPAADHAVSVVHDAPFRDGSVSLRFLLPRQTDSLGLNFADRSLPSVHAGHLFVVRISVRDVRIQDLKTGNMDLQIREARLAETLTADQKKMLQSKTRRFSHSTSAGEWHSIEVTVHGDTVEVSIDGDRVGEFASAGFEHPTKRLLRLAVPGEALVDDVEVRSFGR